MRGGDQAMYAQSRFPILSEFAQSRDLLVWPLGAMFLVAHTLLYWTLTNNLWASALAALSMCVPRHALGGDYWGFDGPSSVSVRSAMAGVIPLLLLLPGYWPLLALIHPTTVWCLLARRDNTGDPQVARAAILYRFAYLFHPIDLRTTASVAVHLALPLTCWWLMGAPLLWFVAWAVYVSLFGPAVVQLESRLRRRPPVDIQLMRAFRLVYPVLGAGFAFVYATQDVVVGACVFLLSLIPPAWVVRLASNALNVPPSAPHMPGDDDVEGRRWKEGALAYLQGTGPMVRWYGGLHERS